MTKKRVIRRSVRVSLGLGLFIAGALALAPLRFAATPTSGALSPTSPTLTWAGGPYTGVTADPSLCTSLTCDTFMLSVSVPASYYSANPTASVRVKVAWGSSRTDSGPGDASGRRHQEAVNRPRDGWQDCPIAIFPGFPAPVHAGRV